jgi:protoporphyrinogen oxidase
MATAIVGGGVLGLTLAWRLSALGVPVDVLEAQPFVGGLASARDYGEFRWDRFYHCLLPSDAHLIGLVKELGLGDELRWTAARTGYFGGGRFHEMTGGRDYLRFPLLSFLQKARLGAALAWATRFTDPAALYEVSAADWLTRLCGRRTFEVFWQPLLRAKFGVFHDRVAAVFLWATLQRLWKPPAAGQRRGTLGYVRGGYDVILGRLHAQLVARGVRFELGASIERIGLSGAAAGAGAPPRATIDLALADGRRDVRSYDQVLFTAPAGEARRLADETLRPEVERFTADHPAASTYLGVVCTVLVLARPLTPYYVVNLADEKVELTGLIEMTNLIDAPSQSAGRSLVYLPRYVDSQDPVFESKDAAIVEAALDRGVRRLFPDLRDDAIVGRFVHRARHVQALPTVRPAPKGAAIPSLCRPFQIVNSALLNAATLNNDEIVGLADAFVEKNAAGLAAAAPGARAPSSLSAP